MNKTWLTLATSFSLLAGCATDGPAAEEIEPGEPGMEEETMPPTVLAKVDGVVVDRQGLPLAGKLVFIAGNALTTDTEGRFTAVDVIAPYDVTVTETGSSTVTSFVGLTTVAPKVVHTYWPESRDATIAGGLSTPTVIGDLMFLGVTSAGTPFTMDIYAPNFNAEYARWYGPTKTTANIIALKYKEGANKLPISYEALGTTTVAVEDGKVTSGIALPAINPGEATITGQLSYAPGVTWSSVRAYAATGGGSVQVARIDGTAATSSFSTVMPTGVGIKAGFSAQTVSPSGKAIRFVHDVATDVQGLQLAVPAPPTLVAPAAGAVVKPGDRVEWSDDSANLFVVEIGQFDPMTFGYPYYSRTVTSGHSLTIPELSSYGVPWLAGRQTYIWVYAYNLPWTLDEAAGHSFDDILDNAWGSDGQTSVDGSLAFNDDGFAFTSTK